MRQLVFGKPSLGIELGSTRIKAVLTGEDYSILAVGAYEWENKLEGGFWTYSLDSVWAGIQAAFAELKSQVKDKYGISLKSVKAIGVSAMMHGYLVFGAKDNLLVPFRTWRNTTTGEASEKLTKEFNFNIPQRWSIAHLYQAILNNEKHIKDIAHITTLAGYVHYMLTGKRVVGIGEASGMLPVKNGGFDAEKIKVFEEIIKNKNLPWKLKDILPEVKTAGEIAGTLTKVGALLIDPSGELESGNILCPPEGDAGTGMVATNSVSTGTGNVSAGTSVFAMVVLEKDLSKVYSEADIVTTPDGKPVAMIHCNNCTSDINAWAGLFSEVIKLAGADITNSQLFTMLFEKSLESDINLGGLLNYNYFSGEPITNLSEGRPLFVRNANSDFTLANFMKTQIYSSLATLKIGMEILEKENVKIENMYGHGGFFKTKNVGQRAMAAAINAPVSVMETAGEGGAWGMALLAAFAAEKAKSTLGSFLNEVFANEKAVTLTPQKEDIESFNKFMERYKKGLAVEQTAVENLR